MLHEKTSSHSHVHLFHEIPSHHSAFLDHCSRKDQNRTQHFAYFIVKHCPVHRYYRLVVVYSYETRNWRRTPQNQVVAISVLPAPTSAVFSFYVPVFSQSSLFPPHQLPRVSIALHTCSMCACNHHTQFDFKYLLEWCKPLWYRQRKVWHQGPYCCLDGTTETTYHTPYGFHQWTQFMSHPTPLKFKLIKNQLP